MNLDLERIQAKVQFIKNNLIILSGLSSLDEQVFLSDVRNFLHSGPCAPDFN